jgi:hypothetical protein
MQQECALSSTSTVVGRRTPLIKDSKLGSTRMNVQLGFAILPFINHDDSRHFAFLSIKS